MYRVPRSFALVTIFLLLAASAATSQALNSLSSGKAENPANNVQAPVDPLHRGTPRESIYKFLGACHRNKFDLAAQYLDLKRVSSQRRTAEGPELASQLCTLLDHNANFEVGKLSDSPEGNITDNLPNTDELAAFELNGEPVTLRLERTNTPAEGAVWLISSESVTRIPELAALIEQSSIERHLPAPFTKIKLIGTPLWIWIALLLIAVLLSAVSRLLSRLFLALVRPLTRRYTKVLHTQRLEALTEPLRLLLSLLVFRAVVAFIPPSALLRDYLSKLLILLFALGAASLLMRLVDVASDTILSRLDHRERALTYSVFPLGIRFVKIIIFCFAVLVVLQQWGYNTSTILAGVGVGGIAIALAAQKTIENLFGGVSLISDRPVLVGDFCQFGGQLGTVEDIGLRSTRIRTLDRTVVTVPNSQFSTMTLENFSKRDRMWFHPTIRLRRDTTPAQVGAMMDAITRILQEHQSVDASGVPLRFSKITDQTLDLDIFAYVLTPDSNEFLKIQTELLLKILEASYALGIGLAVPVQEAYNVTLNANEPQPTHPFLAFKAADGRRVNDELLTRTAGD